MLHLHLAENRASPTHPFALLATHLPSPLSRHVPLGRALAQAASSRAAILDILRPLESAAGACEPLASAYRSGAILGPLAWTAAEAAALLRARGAIESAGAIVHLPRAWPAAGRRVTARAVVGEREVALVSLGASALLDFRVSVAMGGEALSAEEVAAIRAAGDAGLVQVRGQWAEVDARALGDQLDAWEELAACGGVTAREALQLAEDEGVEAGAHFAAVLARVRRPEELAGDPPVVLSPEHFRATLRPYQEVGRRWLRMLTGLGLGACLADSPGLGKTAQTLAFLVERALARAASSLLPDLLVVPASLVGNWTAEIAKFAPRLRVRVAHPSVEPPEVLRALTTADLAAHDLVITTYGALQRYSVFSSARFGLAVLDEAQAVKNHDSQQARAVKSVQSDGRIALTGTPVENRLLDLHSIFEFLNPGLLGSRRAFQDSVRRMRASAAAEGGGDELGELRALVLPYILRRLKTDKSVISDLPDKTEVAAYCSLTREQAALYQQIVDDLARALEEGGAGIARSGAVLTALLRLKQACNHPSQVTGEGDFAGALSGKHARLSEIVDGIAGSGEKILVFTQFREMVDPLMSWLSAMHGGSEGLALHGGTPVSERQGIVRRFQEDASVPFMVLSLRAGGTGLNLTAASHVVHFDRWWNFAVEDQATDRAYRIGQHRCVVVHKFVVRGTVEERVDALIASKRGIAGAVLGEDGGVESAIAAMGDREILELVALDRGRAVAEG